MIELHTNTLSITAGKYLLTFVWSLSGNLTINFSYIILSTKKPSKYHMELSFQFASVLFAKQQTGQ